VARPALIDLGLPTDQIAGWTSRVIAAFLVGAAAGGVLFGWLGDRIGRVRAMVWSVLVYSIFSGLCGFAEAPWHLAALRFIASLGMGGEWSLGVALVMEIWPTASRPLLAGLIGAAANVGFLLIALVGLALSRIVGGLEELLREGGVAETTIVYLLGEGRSGWRILLFLGAAPALLTLVIRVFVPESKRWREAAEREKPATLADIFAPGLLRHTVLGATLGAIALIGTWGAVQFLPNWADRLARGTSWAGGARSETQIASSIGAIVGSLLAGFVADRLSRRSAYFMLSALSLAACGWLFWRPAAYGLEFLIAVGTVGMFTASFYGWLPLYLPELFPTRVRATGAGFCFNFGRVLAAGGAIASGVIIDANNEDYSVMGRSILFVYVLGAGVIWLCPETKGKPLPD
jgi:MFS family permease